MGQITIIGLGLIGGSLGMAWRQAKIGWDIVGHDKNPEVAAAARKKGAVDRTEWNLPAAVEKANVVVLATPVGEMKALFGHIADCLAEDCVVTDTASTKRQVLAWAEEMLPPSVTFVGGHPVVAREAFGIEGADAGLFSGRLYCLTPSSQARPNAIDLVSKLVGAIGAEPYFVDAVEHDGLVAATGHLPLVVSTALVRAAAAAPAWREISRMAASDFLSVSRLASGDPAGHAGICEANRENIVRWLDAYIAALGEMRRLIVDGGQALETAFSEAKAARDTCELGRMEDTSVRVDIPTAREQLGQTFFGSSGRLFKRDKK